MYCTYTTIIARHVDYRYHPYSLFYVSLAPKASKRFEVITSTSLIKNYHARYHHHYVLHRSCIESSTDFTCLVSDFNSKILLDNYTKN